MTIYHVVPLPSNVIMANELVFDVAKGIGKAYEVRKLDARLARQYTSFVTLSWRAAAARFGSQVARRRGDS